LPAEIDAAFHCMLPNGEFLTPDGPYQGRRLPGLPGPARASRG
jgi:hypothetical protein